nr:hypothetical protein [Tanacetum cinerariifolium]
MNNAKVIAPGMFRICPDKVSREAKKMPNIVSASSRTKPITVSQPSVITKKNENSDLNGLSSTGLDNTKTRRPQPRSNTKNDRVPSVSKSSRSKNKEVKVEGRKHKANVSKNETQKKYQPKASKPKNVGTRESLATLKPRKPRFLFRWSPTGRLFDQDGKLVAPSNSESHIDCSKGDNACTSNAMKPKIKWFPKSTSLLGRLSRFFMMRRLSCSKHMTGNLKLLINFVWKFMGTVRFRNDHVAAILGFGDLQWGSILITRVYFVERLGHNLFSVGQFCDSDLEVAFRRNA